MLEQVPFHRHDGVDSPLVDVTENQIILSDVTTNNATTVKHGFLPKLPNDSAKFLDGNGNFNIPTMNINAGVFNKDMSTTTTDTIAHGLGKAPIFVELLLLQAISVYG